MEVFYWAKDERGKVVFGGTQNALPHFEEKMSLSGNRELIIPPAPRESRQLNQQLVQVPIQLPGQLQCQPLVLTISTNHSSNAQQVQPQLEEQQLEEIQLEEQLEQPQLEQPQLEQQQLEQLQLDQPAHPPPTADHDYMCLPGPASPALPENTETEVQSEEVIFSQPPQDEDMNILILNATPVPDPAAQPMPAAVPQLEHDGGLQSQHEIVHEHVEGQQDEIPQCQQPASAELSDKDSNSDDEDDTPLVNFRKRPHDGQDDVYDVECIKGKKKIDGLVHYLVKWKGYTDEESSWEPRLNINPALIKLYNDSVRRGKETH